MVTIDRGAFAFLREAKQKVVFSMLCGEVCLYISFLNKAHGDSSRPCCLLGRCSSGAEHVELKARMLVDVLSIRSSASHARSDTAELMRVRAIETPRFRRPVH